MFWHWTDVERDIKDSRLISPVLTWCFFLLSFFTSPDHTVFWKCCVHWGRTSFTSIRFLQGLDYVFYLQARIPVWAVISSHRTLIKENIQVSLRTSGFFTEWNCFSWNSKWNRNNRDWLQTLSNQKPKTENREKRKNVVLKINENWQPSLHIVLLGSCFFRCQVFQVRWWMTGLTVHICDSVSHKKLQTYL